MADNIEAELDDAATAGIVVVLLLLSCCSTLSFICGLGVVMDRLIVATCYPG